MFIDGRSEIRGFFSAANVDIPTYEFVKLLANQRSNGLDAEINENGVVTTTLAFLYLRIYPVHETGGKNDRLPSTHLIDRISALYCSSLIKNNYKSNSRQGIDLYEKVACIYCAGNIVN